MADTPKAHQITLEVTAETLEQITLLAEREGASVSEMAGKLLADEAEARAGLTRGPYLRKYMHR
jgi:hypothetical protein